MPAEERVKSPFSFSAEEMDVFANFYREAATVYNKTNNLIIVVIYRPYLIPFLCFKKCLESIKSFIHQYHADNINVGGFQLS